MDYDRRCVGTYRVCFNVNWGSALRLFRVCPILSSFGFRRMPIAIIPLPSHNDPMWPCGMDISRLSHGLCVRITNVRYLSIVTVAVVVAHFYASNSFVNVSTLPRS